MTPENEEKKKYLMRYKWGKKKIEEIGQEIVQLRLSALPRAITYDGMPKGPAPTSDMLSGYAAELDRLIADLEASGEKLYAELSEMIRAIEAVEDPRCSILLRYRYIQLKNWMYIAEQMGYSEVYVKGELHGMALNLFKIPEVPTKSYTYL